MTLQNPIAPHCRAMSGVVAPHTPLHTPAATYPTTQGAKGAGGAFGGRGARAGEMPLRVLDLFSGIGGFSLGLERAGMQTVAFCEIDLFARRVLAKHWPEVPCHDDIRTLTADWLAENGLWPDVICGGFPCQDISVAGKGAGIGGERSGLWREYARLIGEIRPRYVIVENVAALLGRGLGDVLGDLAALGYDAEWHCIPASAVGAPHQRDRIWVVAYPAWDGGGWSRLGIEHGSACFSGTIGQRTVEGQDATAALADPDSRGWREQGHVCQAPRYTRAGQSGNGGAVPIPSKSRLEIGQGALREWAHAATTGTGWWATRAEVCGMAFGSPERLDKGGLNAAAQKTGPDQALRAMQNPDDAQTIRRDAGEHERPQPSEVLRPNLHGAGAHAFGTNAGGGPEACEEVSPTELRGLRQERTSIHPSSGPKLEEQPSGEFADVMHELSYVPTPSAGRSYYQGGQTPMWGLRQAIISIGALSHTSHAVQEAWQSLSDEDKDWCRLSIGRGPWHAEWPGISRVVDGPAAKVDRRRRLIALGNAVVPQIPELVGRAIMAQVGE